MYLSGGSMKPKFFAVYNSCDNQWQVLPDLPDQGRERHAMVAINSCIYVIGGMNKINENGNTYTSSSVLKYALNSSEWTVVCHLPVHLLNATAAVLGHRIYVLGWGNTREENTDLVQCVDTLTGCAYVASRLSYSTYGSRVLSNGGIIYVVLATGKVLQMWEDFYLSEQAEKILNLQKFGGDVYQNYKETVSFRQIGKVSERLHFSACLIDGSIIVFGGLTDEGVLFPDIEAVCLETGSCCSNTSDLQARIYCNLHTLNVPLKHLTKAHTVP